jgi:hypothetical protein
MGQGPHFRKPSTCSLPCYESYFCWSSSMFVFIFWFYDRFVLIFFPGRDYDYQTLNLSFAVNVVKFGLIIGMFPKPLKPCVVPSICVKIHMPFSLKPTLVLCHACCRTFPPRFDKKLNSSDQLSRNDLQKWRSMERTGMTSRFVGPLYPSVLSH